MRGGHPEVMSQLLRPSIERVEECLTSGGAVRDLWDPAVAWAGYRRCHPIGGGLLKAQTTPGNVTAAFVSSMQRILMDGLYVAQVYGWHITFTRPGAVLVTTLEAATARPKEVLGAVMDHLGLPRFSDADAARIASQGDGAIRRAALALQLAPSSLSVAAVRATGAAGAMIDEERGLQQLLKRAQADFSWFYHRESRLLCEIANGTAARFFEHQNI